MAPHDSDLIKKILTSIATISSFEKRQVIEFNGQKIHSSEIHMLIALQHHSRNITKLAQKLHLTKGAVSQTISRLEKKGILLKNPNPKNKNELNITMTAEGEHVIKKISHFHDNLAHKLSLHTHAYTLSEIETISTFIDHLERLFSS